MSLPPSFVLSRRTFAAGAVCAAILTPRASWAAAGRLRGFQAAVAALEHRHGCRMGVAVVDTGTGERADHKGGERFAMCSTFKWLLAAALLREVDLGHARLEDAQSIPAEITLGHSPLTLPHAGATMPLGELARASIVQSDNTAANLLIERLGGPAAVTAKWRALGDPISRLDRMETILNEATPGDPRDTTTPLQAVACLQRYLLGDTLSPTSRQQLTAWLKGNETGTDCLRAGLPASWTEGDKTGSNGSTTRNDIAIAWPPGRPPVLIAAFLTDRPGEDAGPSGRNSILAEVGSLVGKALA